MVSHLSLAEFKVKYGILSKSDFTAKFRAPFLIVEFGAIDNPPGKAEDGAGAPPMRERTRWGEAGAAELQALAVPLVKSDRNEKGDRITVGRTEDNDVVILHHSVSKYHAYFIEDPESGELLLGEAGSTYGTTLNGHIVRKGQDVPLENRASLVFAASVLATFFIPDVFYDYMHIMAEPK